MPKRTKQEVPPPRSYTLELNAARALVEERQKEYEDLVKAEKKREREILAALEEEKAEQEEQFEGNLRSYIDDLKRRFRGKKYIFNDLEQTIRVLCTYTESNLATLHILQRYEERYGWNLYELLNFIKYLYEKVEKKKNEKIHPQTPVRFQFPPEQGGREVQGYVEEEFPETYDIVPEDREDLVYEVPKQQVFPVDPLVVTFLRGREDYYVLLDEQLYLVAGGKLHEQRAGVYRLYRFELGALDYEDELGGWWTLKTVPYMVEVPEEND